MTDSDVNNSDRALPPGLAQPAEAWAGAARLAFYTPVVEPPSVADRKATFLLTMTGLMATTLFFFLEWLRGMVTSPDRVFAVLVATAVSVLIGLLLAMAVHAYAGYTTALPRHPALSFPRRVGEMRPGDYADAMRRLTAADAVEAMLQYNYSAATQAVAKYAHVNKSLACARWAIPLWMALLLLTALWR